MAPQAVERLKIRIEHLEVKLRQKDVEVQALKGELAQKDFAIAAILDEHRVELGRLRDQKNQVDRREEKAKHRVEACESSLKLWKVEAEKLHAEAAKRQAYKEYDFRRLYAVERWAVYQLHQEKGKSKLVAMASSESEAHKIVEELKKGGDATADYRSVSGVLEIKREISIPYERWELLPLLSK